MLKSYKNHVGKVVNKVLWHLQSPLHGFFENWLAFFLKVKNFNFFFLVAPELSSNDGIVCFRAPWKCSQKSLQRYQSVWCNSSEALCYQQWSRFWLYKRQLYQGNSCFITCFWLFVENKVWDCLWDKRLKQLSIWKIMQRCLAVFQIELRNSVVLIFLSF